MLWPPNPAAFTVQRSTERQIKRLAAALWRSLMQARQAFTEGLCFFGFQKVQNGKKKKKKVGKTKVESFENKQSWCKRSQKTQTSTAMIAETSPAPDKKQCRSLCMFFHDRKHPTSAADVNLGALSQQRGGGGSKTTALISLART